MLVNLSEFLNYTSGTKIGEYYIRPVALNSFRVTPQLPVSWNYMKLKNVHGFQNEFEIDVKREGEKIRLTVTCGGALIVNKLIDNGSSQTVKF